jgi:hypothetical protein
MSQLIVVLPEVMVLKLTEDSCFSSQLLFGQNFHRLKRIKMGVS